MLPEPHPGPPPNPKKSIVPKRDTPNTYPCQPEGGDAGVRPAERLWKHVWYVDVGKGSALPALQSLLADAKSPERGFDTVLVYSFARLSRDMVEFHAIRLGLREVGVELVSVSEDGVSSTPTDRLIESIIQAVNDYHRRVDDCCRERHSQATRRGIEVARRRRQGC